MSKVLAVSLRGQFIARNGQFLFQNISVSCDILKGKITGQIAF